MTHIFGLGNAIVDVEVDVEDSFLDEQNLPKGQMVLVDSQQVSALTAALEGSKMQRCSGGSAANTIFCLLYTSPSPRDVEESRMPSSA